MRIDRKVTTFAAALAATAFVMATNANAQRADFDNNGSGRLGYFADSGGRIIPVQPRPEAASARASAATAQPKAATKPRTKQMTR